MRKLILAALALATIASSEARGRGDGGSYDFSYSTGEKQVNLILGKGMFYEQPDIMWMNNSPAAVSITDPDGYLGTVLNITDPNSNLMVNMVGAEFKYFVTDNIAISFLGAGFITNTPKRDGIPSVTEPGGNTVVPAYMHIDATMTTRVVTALGGNYYFQPSNSRVHPYAGVSFTFQYAQLQANSPFTNIPATDAGRNQGSRVGETIGLSPSLVAGIDYSLAPGLLIGFEIQPVGFFHSGVKMRSAPGNPLYTANNNEFSFLGQPRLKLGFQF